MTKCSLIYRNYGNEYNQFPKVTWQDDFVGVGQRDLDSLADADLSDLQRRQDVIDDVIVRRVVHVALEDVGGVHRHLEQKRAFITEQVDLHCFKVCS